MSEIRESYRATGLIVVALAIFLIAFDLAFFALCDSGLSVCFSWSTNRVSDLALLLFFGLFLVGIAILAWPVGPPLDRPSGADRGPAVPDGARVSGPVRRGPGAREATADPPPSLAER